MSKASEMEELKKTAGEQLTCDPARPRARIVWGEGNPDARIVLVGEAPGDVEERLGRPFVGSAGELLNELLRQAGINREGIWITNVVKCRPTTETGGSVANRPPRVGEIRESLPWLEKELEIIQPRVIVSLGGVAAKALIGKDFRLAEQRGETFQRDGRDILATYHPAYLLRLVGIDPDRYSALARAVVQDLLKAVTLSRSDKL
ncbi:MAG: uracil-DNA glycosylase [Chloroflexi bacterium]|nr:uracil-DNA glycosylase [Chloroflexota bacterium]